jgi:hypothetical protein
MVYCKAGRQHTEIRHADRLKSLWKDVDQCLVIWLCIRVDYVDREGIVCDTVRDT